MTRTQRAVTAANTPRVPHRVTMSLSDAPTAVALTISPPVSARDDGGHVFVLEDRPWHRVAHAHVVVVLGGDQWRNYLRLRDLLRESPAARERYTAVKRRLVEGSRNDRDAYTMGKTDIVKSLIATH